MSDALNRREFLTAGSLAAGSLAAASTVHSADEPPKAASPIDRILALVLDQYADKRLDVAALEEIRGDIQQHLNRSAVLSSFPLENGDEPGFVFRGHRAP